jgi:hypothetical protein
VLKCVQLNRWFRMTTTEALNLIDQVCARFSGTWDDHVNLQTAIAVLRQAVEPKPTVDGPATKHKG